MKKHCAAVSEIIFENGPAKLKVEGNSMWPQYCDGQVVTVMPFNSKKLSLGRCYIYYNNGVLVIHRLLWALKTVVYMAGDRNNYIEKVNREYLLGMTEPGCCKMALGFITIVNTLFLPFSGISCIFWFRSKLLSVIIRRGCRWN